MQNAPPPPPIIHQPRQQGTDAAGYAFAGFAADSQHHLAAGQALWLQLQKDDLVSCDFTAQMRVAALALEDGEDAMPSIFAAGGSSGGSLAASAAPVDSGDYDSRLISARLRGLGLRHTALTFYQCPAHLDEAIIWRAPTPLVLLIVLPETREALVTGTAAASDSATCTASVQRANAADYRHLPAPLARVQDEFTIPKGTARAYRLPKGAFVQIIDLQGRQCSDFLAFNSNALDNGQEQHIDSTVSRTFTRAAYPRPGLFNKFYDSDITPLLALVQDTVGRHDTFALACTARGYEERGFPGHVNCSDNISAAVAQYHIGARRAWPAINFFFNSWILPANNQLAADEAWSRPGDYVLMQALEDLVCVSTACPDDIDPINGWNPTDIHIRIYDSPANIKPAVAYRTTPNEPATMTTESPFHAKTSLLTNQYHAHLDYWVPQCFDATGAVAEYWACRERATMQDAANLRILDIAGNDSFAFLQHLLTRDIARLALHKGVYALACDSSGHVVDDGTLFNIGADLYRWTGTNPEALLHFRQVAQAGGYRVWLRDVSKSLCTLAVQGPLSRDILAPLLFVQPTQPAFANVKWFGGCVARLHERRGVPLYVCRTGYTGELGYELFCDARDAAAVWDAVAAAEAGGERITPMGSDALNLLRVESGLMAMGSEWGDRVDAFDAGLGFAINLDKAAFIGKDALARNAKNPRQKLVGLVLDGGESAAHGDSVYPAADSTSAIGVITSSVFSPALQKPIALARIAIEHAADGTPLAIGKLDGRAKRLTASVTAIPFVDPQRQRPRS